MRRRNYFLTEDMKSDIVRRYQNLDRMEIIAKDLNVTRQCVYKIIRKAGIDTSKEARVERICPTCGAVVKRTRGRARQAKQSFCSQECYIIWMETLGEQYKPSCYYSRQSREIVKKYFDYRPEDGHILHHINKDVSDMRKANLMVFASQRDHVRFHRGFSSTPLWSGAAPQNSLSFTISG